MSTANCVRHVIVYLLLSFYATSHLALSFNATTDASTFGSCVVNPTSGQWESIVGSHFNLYVTSQTDCAAFCALVSDVTAGFYDAATTTCFCGTIDSGCGDCSVTSSTSASACDSDSCVTPSSPLVDGDDVCARSYISNAFYTSSAYSLGGFQVASSSQTWSVSVSSSDATSIYTCTYGDGYTSQTLTSAATAGQQETLFTHQYLLAGSFQWTVASDRFPNETLSAAVNVQDVPKITSVSSYA